MVSTRLRVRELLRERRWTTKVLSEKTGMSESYLTHIKNATRRWNEDALAKLAVAFEVEPTELFAYQTPFKKAEVKEQDEVIEGAMLDQVAFGRHMALKQEQALRTLRDDNETSIRIVPVVGEIPQFPSEHNNEMAQINSGYTGVFVPVFGNTEPNMFCYRVRDDAMEPEYVRGDMLVFAPHVWSKNGDVVAVEYNVGGAEEKLAITVARVSYLEDFVLLEKLDEKRTPLALIHGKDQFRVIAKVVARYQKC